VNVTCKLNAGLPDLNALQASGSPSFLITRSLQISAETNEWRFFRVSPTGNVLRSIELGSFPTARSVDVQILASGALMRITQPQSEVLEFRFFDTRDQELWRISTASLPAISGDDVAQADASGMTIFARSARTVYRLRSNATVLWQDVIPTQWQSLVVQLSADGSAIVSASQPTDFDPKNVWRWLRSDGAQVLLPDDLRGLCFADGGGALGLVASTRSASAGLAERSSSASSDAASPQFLWRFDALGAVQSKTQIANSPLAPSAVQMQANLVGGVDIAATYTAQPSAGILRISGDGAVQTQFDLPLKNALQMNSVEQLFIRTTANSLARIAANGALLWDQALFFGAREFQFLPVTDGAAAITDGMLRTVNAQGSVIGSLTLPSFPRTEFRCYRTDVQWSSDQHRCLYRAQSGNPVEIYGIDPGLRIQLRQVLFRHEPVLAVAANGDLLIDEQFGQNVALARVTADGRLRWRKQLQSNLVQLIATADGAWTLETRIAEPRARNTVIVSYINSKGESVVALTQLLGASRAFVALADSSLILANESKLMRLQPSQETITLSEKPFAVGRVYASGLNSVEMRTTWIERSAAGETAYVSVFDWPLVNGSKK
jgi:hypothetical protein